MVLKPGDRFLNWTVVQRLGGGAFGEGWFFFFFIINKSSLISHPIFSFPDQKQRRRTLGAQNGISKCTNQCVDDGCHSAPGRRQGATAISTFLQVRGQWPLRKFSKKMMNSLSITFQFFRKTSSSI